MITIFGHIFYYDSSSPFLGRSVADREFLIALQRYGTFDEYHFFCESERIRDDLQGILAEVLQNPMAQARVKIFFISDLEKQLASTSYTVFHATDPMIDKLLQMRDTFNCAEPFAVTGYTHTLSSRHLGPGMLLTLMQKPGRQDAIICSSQSGKQVMEKIYAQIAGSFQQTFNNDISYHGQLPHIPLGINTADYGQITKAEARTKLGFPQNEKIILSIARLTPSSKMDYYPLIDVFAEVLRANPSTKLVLAGGVTEEKENYLKELQTYAMAKGITKEIILYPNFPLEHKHLLYSAADIFISPSDNLQETFGITIIEALASGLPVVCSDWNGYKELVEDGVTGYKIKTIMQKSNQNADNLALFSLNPSYIVSQFTAIDQQEMVSKLHLLLTDEDSRQLLGRNAMDNAGKYDWSRLIPQYEQLWLELKNIALNEKTNEGFNLPFSYSRLFDHYPTIILAKDHVIKTTKTGVDILTNKQDLSINFVIQKQLDFGLLAAILRTSAKTQIALKDLLEKLAQYDKELIQSHIIWLLKYNALELV